MSPRATTSRRCPSGARCGWSTEAPCSLATGRRRRPTSCGRRRHAQAVGAHRASGPDGRPRRRLDVGERRDVWLPGQRRWSVRGGDFVRASALRPGRDGPAHPGATSQGAGRLPARAPLRRRHATGRGRRGAGRVGLREVEDAAAGSPCSAGEDGRGGGVAARGSRRRMDGAGHHRVERGRRQAAVDQAAACRRAAPDRRRHVLRRRAPGHRHRLGQSRVPDRVGRRNRAPALRAHRRDGPGRPPAGLRRRWADGRGGARQSHRPARRRDRGAEHQAAAVHGIRDGAGAGTRRSPAGRR